MGYWKRVAQCLFSSELKIMPYQHKGFYLSFGTISVRLYDNIELGFWLFSLSSLFTNTCTVKNLYFHHIYIYVSILCDMVHLYR